MPVSYNLDDMHQLLDYPLPFFRMKDLSIPAFQQACISKIYCFRYFYLQDLAFETTPLNECDRPARSHPLLILPSHTPDKQEGSARPLLERRLHKL